MKELLKEAEEIQGFLEIELNDNAEEVVMRGAALQVRMARTAKMLADAKQEYNRVKKHEIMKVLGEYALAAGASHTLKNELVKSACHQEQYLVDWLERLNSACVHQLDWCRSVLSLYKEERKITGYQFGNVSN